MRKSRFAGAALAWTMLVAGGGPAFAGSSATATTVAKAAEPKTVVQPGARQAASFLPTDFGAPTLVETSGFKLVPLGPELVKIDFDAYMSSIEHLQKTFTRSTDWPHKNLTSADAMRDMENEQERFKSGKSFAYAVLTPDGTRERGSVYVSPSPVAGYDAIVRMWVTKAEYDAGFDAELYKWVTNWVETAWPFRNVAYPGRSVDWARWDAMVAAARDKKP